MSKKMFFKNRLSKQISSLSQTEAMGAEGRITSVSPSHLNTYKKVALPSQVVFPSQAGKEQKIR